MENLSLLTYTHSKAKDLHKPYYERLLKFFPDMKNIYFTCNENIEYGNCIVYDDNENHSKQMINALESISTDYIIYAQEDYILFDYVKIDDVIKCLNLMESDKNIPFIRLIQSGLGNNLVRYNDDFYHVDPNSSYYFSTQISIWRKSDLIKMYNSSNVKMIFDESQNSVHLRAISARGLFSVKKGSRVGNHHNSWIYPYIATAVVKGKWNVAEYQKELDVLFNEYNINPFERGIVL